MGLKNDFVTYLYLFENCLKGKWETIGNDVQVKFVRIENKLIIYFQCSKSTTDWIQNFKFWLKSYKLPKVKQINFGHYGYVENWESIKLELYNRMTANYFNELYFVGYSHGAALATLAHEYFSTNYFSEMLRSKVATYSFGCPNVIWPLFKRVYNNDHIYNIKVNGDLFSLLPPKLFLFKEVGNVIKIGPKVKWPSVKYHVPDMYKKYMKETIGNEN